MKSVINFLVYFIYPFLVAGVFVACFRGSLHTVPARSQINEVLAETKSLQKNVTGLSCDVFVSSLIENGDISSKNHKVPVEQWDRMHVLCMKLFDRSEK